MSAQVLSWQRVKQLPAPVWLLLWGNFFVRGSYFMVWPFLAVMLYQRYGLSATETGFWLSAAAMLAVAAGFYAGHLSDSFGRKPLMLAGAVTGVLAFAALALANTLPLMLCCIFLATLPRALWDAPRAPISLRSEQQSSLQWPQARRHGEGIVVLFRAVSTPHETIAGAPGRAIAECPHAVLNFLALAPLKLRKSALPAAILLIAAAAFLN